MARKASSGDACLSESAALSTILCKEEHVVDGTREWTARDRPGPGPRLALRWRGGGAGEAG